MCSISPISRSLQAACSGVGRPGSTGWLEGEAAGRPERVRSSNCCTQKIGAWNPPRKTFRNGEITPKSHASQPALVASCRLAAVPKGRASVSARGQSYAQEKQLCDLVLEARENHVVGHVSSRFSTTGSPRGGRRAPVASSGRYHTRSTPMCRYSAAFLNASRQLWAWPITSATRSAESPGNRVARHLQKPPVGVVDHIRAAHGVGPRSTISRFR